MDLSGYKEDAYVFGSSKQSPRDGLHVERSRELHEVLNKQPFKSKELFAEIAPFKKLANVGNAGKLSGAEWVDTYFSDLWDGKASGRSAVFLAWLWWKRPDQAAELYTNVGLKHRPFPVPDFDPSEPSTGLTESLAQHFATVSEISHFFASLFRGENEKGLENLDGLVRSQLSETSHLKRYTAILGTAVAFIVVLVVVTMTNTQEIVSGVDALSDTEIQKIIEGRSGQRLSTQLELLDKALASESDDAFRTAHLLSSRAALGLLKDGQVALADAQKAVMLAPSSTDALVSLALVMIQGGRREEAITHLETAAGLRPGQPDEAATILLDSLWLLGITKRPDVPGVASDTQEWVPSDDQSQNRASGDDYLHSLLGLEEDSDTQADLNQRITAWRRASQISNPLWRDLFLSWVVERGIRLDRDNHFFQLFYERTSSCTQYLAYVVQPYCKMLLGFEQDLAGDESAAIRAFLEAAEFAEKEGQALVAVHAKLARAYLFVEGPSNQWLYGIELLNEAVSDARKTGDIHAVFAALNALAGAQNVYAQDPDAALGNWREAYKITDGMPEAVYRELGFLSILAALEYSHGNPERAAQMCHNYKEIEEEESSPEIWEIASWHLRCSTYLADAEGLANAELLQRARDLFLKYMTSIAPEIPIEEQAYVPSFLELSRIVELRYLGRYWVVDHVYIRILKQLEALDSNGFADHRHKYFEVVLARVENLVAFYLTTPKGNEADRAQLADLILKGMKIADEQFHILRQPRENPDLVSGYKHRQLLEVRMSVGSLFDDEELERASFSRLWNLNLSRFVNFYAKYEHVGRQDPIFSTIELSDGHDIDSAELIAPDKVDAIIRAMNKRPEAVAFLDGNRLNDGLSQWARFLSLNERRVVRIGSIEMIILAAMSLELSADQDLPWSQSARMTEGVIFLYHASEAAYQHISEYRDAFATLKHRMRIKYIDFLDGTRGAARILGTKTHMWNLLLAAHSARELDKPATAFRMIQEYEKLHEQHIGICDECGAWQNNIAGADFGIDTLEEYFLDHGRLTDEANEYVVQ